MFRNAAVKGREKLDNFEMDLGEKKSSGLCGMPAGPQTALLLLSPGQELLTLPKVSRQARTGGQPGPWCRLRAQPRFSLKSLVQQLPLMGQTFAPEWADSGLNVAI